jgi:hypothetical protein
MSGNVVFVPASSAPGFVGISTTFETVNKNLSSYPNVFTYVSKKIDNIVYDLGGGFTITKTFLYTGNKILSVTLSGDIPAGIDTVKTFTYSGNDIDTIVYT